MKKVLEQITQISLENPTEGFFKLSELIKTFAYPENIDVLKMLISIAEELESDNKKMILNDIKRIEHYVFCSSSKKKDLFFHKENRNSLNTIEGYDVNKLKSVFKEEYRPLYKDLIETAQIMISSIYSENKRNIHKLNWLAKQTVFVDLIRALVVKGYIQYPGVDKTLVARSLNSLFNFNLSSKKASDSTMIESLRKVKSKREESIDPNTNPFSAIKEIM